MKESKQFKSVKQSVKAHKFGFRVHLVFTIIFLDAVAAQSGLTTSPSTRAMSFINNQLLPLLDQGFGSYSGDPVIIANIHGSD